MHSASWANHCSTSTTRAGVSSSSASPSTSAASDISVDVASSLQSPYQLDGACNGYSGNDGWIENTDDGVVLGIDAYDSRQYLGEHNANVSVHKRRQSVAERRALKSDKSRKVAIDLRDDAAHRSPVESEALRAYESFHRIPHGTASLAQVIRSSAGVEGWHSFARVLDVVSADANHDKVLLDKQLTRDRMFQQMGIVDEVSAGRRIKKSVSFEDQQYTAPVLMPRPHVNIFEVQDPIAEGDAEVLATEAEWEDVEFEVALDSGSQDHVCDEVDCPGYVTEASPGSSRGQCFVVGVGGKLQNMGQRSLNIQPMADSPVLMNSCFQIARVTRPLMSVGQMCDHGLTVTFDDVKAVVRDKEGTQICVFKRKPGGLYLGKFRLKCPKPGFAGRG